MTVEHRLPLRQLPAKLVRSIVQDARWSHTPVPTFVVIGIRASVLRYYRIAAQ